MLFYILRHWQPLEVLEKEMLNGQKLQGVPTAAEVNHMLVAKKLEKRSEFIYIICNVMC